MIEQNAKWDSQKAMVPFFNMVAHNNGFHPTKEHECWYNIKREDIVCYKVCANTTLQSSCIHHTLHIDVYLKGGGRIVLLKKSYKTAIVDAYPSVQFLQENFGTYC